MATAPQKRVKTNWIVLAVLAIVLAVGVAYFASRQPEEIGGSLTAGDTNFASTESADGPDAAVPPDPK